MLRLKRLFVLLAASILTFLGMSLPSPRALGQQTGVPSTDQIEMFRNLSSDQQDAILRQLGGGNSSSSGLGSLGGTGNTGGMSNDRQGGVSDRQRSNQEADTGAAVDDERQPLIPIIKGEDWVIVEIDFHLPPRPVPQSVQAMYGQGAPSSQNLQALQMASAAGGAIPPAAAAPPAPAAQGPVADLSDDAKKRLQDLMGLIRSKNPYRLSIDGVLSLPGFAGIALLGLNEEQATLRLKAEPAFRDLDVRITRLPLKKTGAEGLKPFGYD